MIILGKHSDDKGTQLERLTMQLLQSFKYKNCAISEIRAGGAELDVTGELEISEFPLDARQRVFCECKALKGPASTDHWLKFLGKVFSEEQFSPEPIRGLFIALSGVNGNVKGNYEDLRQKKRNVQLLTGDDLTQLLTKHYPIAPLRMVQANIRSLTDRTIVRSDLAYYSNALYWIIVFANDEYTALTGSGTSLSEPDVSLLCPLISQEIETSQYIDLTKEAKAVARRQRAKSLCLSDLIIQGGIASSFDSRPARTGFTDVELRDAANALVVEGLLQLNGSGEFALSGNTDALPKIFATLLRDQCLKECFGSECYDRLINDDLLTEICRIQGDLPLTQQDRGIALQCIRLSPTAMLHACHPIGLIVEHRKNGQQSNILTDQMDCRVFLRLLFRWLSVDFENGPLPEYLHNTRGLRELETTTTFKLKTTEQVILEHTTTERIGIGQASEELGGGFLRVLLVDDLAEPWNGGVGAKTADQEPSSPKADDGGSLDVCSTRRRDFESNEVIP